MDGEIPNQILKRAQPANNITSGYFRNNHLAFRSSEMYSEKATVALSYSKTDYSSGMALPQQTTDT